MQSTSQAALVSQAVLAVYYAFSIAQPSVCLTLTLTISVRVGQFLYQKKLPNFGLGLLGLTLTPRSAGFSVPAKDRAD